MGAGLDVHEAQRPAVSDLAGGGRVVTVAAGLKSSGVPPHWAATADRPGVAYVGDLSERSAVDLADRVMASKRPGDVTVVSLHWGSNWGYDVEADQVRFAHRLIDAGVDVVYGHSSHHPRPIEVYRGRLILYGCGDLVNDYEGIQPFRAFRDDLRLLYFASLEPGRGLSVLRMVPMRVRRMRLERAGQRGHRMAALHGRARQRALRHPDRRSARRHAGGDGGLTHLGAMGRQYAAGKDQDQRGHIPPVSGSLNTITPASSATAGLT